MIASLLNFKIAPVDSATARRYMLDLDVVLMPMVNNDEV